MIVVMRTGAAQEEIDAVKKAIADEGLETYVMVGEERIVMGVVGTGVERVQLAEAREETGLPVVSEVTDPGDVPLFDEYVDMLQVGARNMANFVLLRAVGQ